MEIAPPGYNVTNFIVLADIERERRGLDAIHVVLVPGLGDGFRAEDVEYAVSHKLWRVRNLVWPATSLLPTCSGTTVCADREEAGRILSGCDDRIFPTGYSIVNPLAYHDYATINALAMEGVVIPRLRATEQARNYVSQWLADHAGERRPIVVTLREASYDIGRNSTVENWAAFAHSLDTSIYCPVIVRDTEAVFSSLPEELEGLPVFHEPSVNIDVRAALYEAAFLNIGINQGPTTLWHFLQDVSYLTIYVNDRMPEGWDLYHINGSGFVRGEDMRWANLGQRTYWGDDSIEEITSEFAAIVEEVELCDRATQSPVARRRLQCLEDEISLAARYSDNGQYHHAAEIYRKVLERDPGSAAANAGLGVTYNRWGSPAKAALHLVDAMIETGAEPLLIHQLACALEHLGRHDEAIRWMQQAVHLDPNNVLFRECLGDLLTAKGHFEEAVTYYRANLLPDGKDVSKIVKLADALFDAGRASEAITYLTKALFQESDGSAVWLRLAAALAENGNELDAICALRFAHATNAKREVDLESVNQFLKKLDIVAPIVAAE